MAVKCLEMANADKLSIIAEMVSDMDFFGIDRQNAVAKNEKIWRVSTRSFERYWSAAQREYEARNEAIKEARLEELKKFERKKTRSEIMGKLERMEILSKIARGEIPLKKPMVADGMIQEVDVVPAWMDRKAAIAELNKMDGEYAPIKKETKHSGEIAVSQDLSQMTTEELKQRAGLIKGIEL